MVKEKAVKAPTDELKKINEILDRSVRPFLKSHGGDVTIVSLEGDVLKVHYQGACGSCPGATMGTLMAIEEVLKEEYNPNIRVRPE